MTGKAKSHMVYSHLPPGMIQVGFWHYTDREALWGQDVTICAKLAGKETEHVLR